MKKRKLGNTDLELTTVGFGTWATGGTGWAFSWGPQDDEYSVKAIQKAMEMGINWIDTAAVYGLGHAEEVVAKAIEGKRDKIILATKCSLTWDENKRIAGVLKKQSIRNECEQSLKRLNTDYIDLYQIHWPNPQKDIEEGWTELVKLKEEGKIRFAGVSNFNVSQMKKIKKHGPIASLQPPYSMLKRDIERDILPYCKSENIGVVAYSPLQVGLLTGKFKQDSVKKLDDEDWRKTKSAHFFEPLYSINLKFVESLKPLAQKYSRTIAQLAIAWVLRREEVTSAIVGARKPSQIEETALAADFEIPKATLANIEKLLKERNEEIKEAGIDPGASL